LFSDEHLKSFGAQSPIFTQRDVAMPAKG